MAFTAKLKKIDQAIGRYYAFNGKVDRYFNNDGIGLFYNYVQENGFGDDEDGNSFYDELGAHPDDSLIVDFDVNDDDNSYQMPGLPKENKTEYILKIIKKCDENPDIEWNNKTILIENDIFEKMDNFEISDQNLERIKKQYRLQCPEEFMKIILKDTNTIKFLAIGVKNQCEYVQNLIDNYFQCQIKNFKNDTEKKTVSNWAINHPHFKKLKNYQRKPKLYSDAVSAVNVLSGRIGNPLLFPTLKRINDKLSEVTHRICDAILFIDKIKANCPFQVDFCQIFKQYALNTEIIIENGSDDDDDDDDDDYDDKKNERQCVDIGNIENKLNNNNLKYILKNMSSDQSEKIRLLPFYNEFAGKVYELADDSKEQSCQHQRFIIFMDRRDYENEKLFMFEPPNDSREIPHNALNLIYFSHSAVCLLPNMDYELSPIWNGDINDDDDDDEKEFNKGKLGAKTACSNPVMTLSFHVMEENVIKCYLFVNRQYIRFMPEDLKIVLPQLFVDDDENKAFVNGNVIDGLIKSITPILKDKYFEAFVQSYCTQL
eukprot:154472_1